jgi:uncharacterized membrane protein YccC
MKLVLSSLLRTAIFALLLPASLLAAQNPDSPAVNQLLTQVKSHAMLADDDAATLSSYLNSRMHWKSHGYKLEQIKGHVNDLIRDSNELVAMRGEGSPWQQEAIDRISQLLPEMAAELTATIQHLRDNQNKLAFAPYRDYVRNNEKLIHTASQMISDFVDYGNAKARSQTLDRQLQLPAGPPSGL